MYTKFSIRTDGSQMIASNKKTAFDQAAGMCYYKQQQPGWVVAHLIRAKPRSSGAFSFG
jgi:hypothetical protein